MTTPPASSVEERLEEVETGEVEIVGRLVEQEHVEAGEQDRRERARAACPPDIAGIGSVEQRGRQTDALDDTRAARASKSAAPSAR